MQRLAGSVVDVDVVVAWVDGSDRRHRAKRQRYLADPGGDAKPERVSHEERRFSDNDEIRFCLRSIHNYAPWARTIWLVTDNQIPAAIDRKRAEQYNIRIVDHREIFRTYEQLLPTFNSLAIESMLWRIEGLADHFLYFNDDMMLVGPVEPADFFSNERAKSSCAAAGPPCKSSSKEGAASTPATSCWAPRCWATRRSISFRRAHAIYPLLRPAMEQLFEEFKPAFLANAEYRFRSRKQFWPISAHNHLLLKSDRAQVVQAPQLGAFLGALLPDGKPGRPRSAAEAAYGRHDAHGLHQLSRGRHRQGARCDAAICRGRPGQPRPSKSRILERPFQACESGHLPGSDQR